MLERNDLNVAIVCVVEDVVDAGRDVNQVKRRRIILEALEHCKLSEH